VASSDIIMTVSGIPTFVLHRLIATSVLAVFYATFTLWLLLILIRTVGSVTGVFFETAKMNRGAFPGFLTLVQITALLFLQLYLCCHFPTTQGTDLWVNVTGRMYFLTANIIPGVLSATCIAQTNRHNRAISWTMENGRLPSPEEAQGFLDPNKSEPSTTTPPTVVQIYLMHFDDWWIKFTYWACDLTKSVTSTALRRLLPRATDTNTDVQPLFGHTTAFPWPEWFTYAISQVDLASQSVVAVYVDMPTMARVCAFNMAVWLQSQAKKALNATKQYIISWHFVDRFAWGIAAAVVGYGLAKYT
jgi:hypothetical protein